LTSLRRDRVIVPSARVTDHLCAGALARGTRVFFQRLTEGLDQEARTRLDRLLTSRDEVRTIVAPATGQSGGNASRAPALIR